MLALAPGLIDSGGQRRVAGLDGDGKAGVAEGVFVSAINPGVAGQRPQLRERLPHLRRRAFKEPAAAEGKQGVAAKERLGPRQMEGEMAAGVAGRSDHADHFGPELIIRAVIDRDVDLGDAGAVGAGGDHRTAVAGLEFGVAADVVGMVMGVEDGVEPPLAGGERRDHRPGLGRVHHGDGPARRIADEMDVVVVERGQDGDVHGGVSLGDALVMNLRRRFFKPSSIGLLFGPALVQCGPCTAISSICGTSTRPAWGRWPGG